MIAEIYITEADKERLKKVIDELLYKGEIRDKSIRNLEQELNRSRPVSQQHIPGDIITMNSKALLRLNNEDVEVTLVYPEDADLKSKKLSVFSPIGSAILGYREGDTIKWEVPSGTAEIHIKKVLYQPEASGDYHM